MRSMLLAVALAIVPTAARAEAPAPERRVYLALKVARVVSLKDVELRGFDHGFDLEAALGVRLHRNLGLELGFGRLALDRSKTGLVGGLLAVNLDETVVVYPAIASLRLVFPTSKLELFALAGGGVYFMSGELEASAPGAAPLTQKDSDRQFALHLGGGVAFRITPRLLVGAEVRYLVGQTDLFLDTFDGPTSFDSLTLGATLAFSL